MTEAPNVAVSRSYLYVPGDQPGRLAKAGGRGADALIADLEDAVAPAMKPTARAVVRRWLTRQAGTLGEVWLRINADQADLDIAEAVLGNVTGVVVPKAERRLLAEVDGLLTAREKALGLPDSAIRLLPLIETATGLLSAAAIAAAPRVFRLGVGEVDLATELGLRADHMDAEMTALRLQVVVASAAAGIAAPVAPMSRDFRDLSALRDSTQALLGLGFRARTAVHPAQIPVINEVFTPAPAEVLRARRLVAAFDAAQLTGTGVTTDDSGRMVDVAVIRSAYETLDRAGRAAGPTLIAAGTETAVRPRVTVLGSLNMDISVTAPQLPTAGMTVLGSAARFAPGGKGANQAVAAARLGAEVRMVGCVGGDHFGQKLLAALHAEHVDAGGVRVVDGVPTGLTMITVDHAGENIITVAPGANGAVRTDDATAARADGSSVLVLSAEIPLPAIAVALTLAQGESAGPPPCRILNLAPVPQHPGVAALLASSGPDWLVVNESEAAALLSRPVQGLAGAEQAAEDLAAAGPRHVVVTAGAHGVVLALPSGGTLTVPGFRVEAVDTVGAGDTFVGALAVALAAGVTATEAVRAAAAAAATAVTRYGTQAAMPRPADIVTATGVTWPVPSAV